MDRRRFLTVAGATLLAGCGSVADGSDTDPDGTSSEAGRNESAGNGSEDQTADVTPTEPAAGTETATPVHASYETTEVVVRTQAGERLGAVTAAISDTVELRYRGLSDTESLPEDRGMLFIFEDPGDRTFVMRGMSFGIDIIYADSDGVITRIHHARAPGPNEDGNDQQYPGYGQYVLEVNKGWTTARGVTEGDILDFDL